MAILKGIISKLNGSAGNLTFKQLGGKTVVSEKISSTTDAKTLPQQKQRIGSPGRGTCPRACPKGRPGPG